MEQQEQRRCKHCGRMLTKIVLWMDISMPMIAVDGGSSYFANVTHMHQPEDDHEASQPAAAVTPPSEEARDFLARAQANPAFNGMIERLADAESKPGEEE